MFKRKPKAGRPIISAPDMGIWLGFLLLFILLVGLALQMGLLCLNC